MGTSGNGDRDAARPQAATEAMADVAGTTEATTAAPGGVEGPGALPRALPWVERAKGVLPMPGGYDGYLTSLADVCDLVVEERPSPAELPARMELVIGVRPKGARLRASFLRKVGLLQHEAGLCTLSSWAREWRATGDARLVAALLHARVQFIGEMLDAARAPCSTDALLTVANERYGMGWDTPAQVSSRRGWLQSCGMLASLPDGQLRTTDAGRSLLASLVIHRPEAGPTDEAVAPGAPAERLAPAEVRLPAGDGPRPTEPDASRPEAQADARRLIDELRAASTDSTNPDRLEQAVRDAFAFLGFRAEWLGGSGKTDVLLDALLGRDDSYRVIVDCKSTGSGSVGAQQVDWVTLQEHQRKHDADHIAIVGPNPSGTRLFGRAVDHGVAVISTERLVGLCSQHARTPLRLDDYRSVFEKGGEPNAEAIEERSGEVERLVRLAVDACDAVRAHAGGFGRLTARDLYLLLSTSAAIEEVSADELQSVLHTLASPLLDVLDGDAATGYRLATSPAVAAQRLVAIAGAIGSLDRRDGTP